jgi:putative metal-binding protein
MKKWIKDRSRCRTLGVIASFGALIFLMTVGFGTAAFADCTDNDGDGYGNPASGDCDHPTLDCNDSDSSIHPGASETCNGIDDDCNSVIDDGFHVGDDCRVGDPGGCSAGDPGGCCLTTGRITCAVDKTAFCDIHASVCSNATHFCFVNSDCPIGGTCKANDQPLKTWSAEGPAGSASCFDGKDNNCDGLTDHQQPVCQTTELCNGFDDNGNGTIDETFPDKGKPCSAGVGACQTSGVYICNAAQDGLDCTATALPAGSENTPGAGNCVDGIDNDCDGFTDIADSSCQAPEKCDGKDNDGDGYVDNGFAGLNDSCTSGTGACQVSGTKVCDVTDPARMTVTCSAAPGAPVTEDLASLDCADGKDNDCDGLTDSADADCNPSALTATCALPYISGVAGNDCTGKHTIVYGATGAGPGAIVTAEILALDLQGNIKATLPVKYGDTAHLASRIDPAGFIAVTRHSGRGGMDATHQVFAPVPLLHVTVVDGKNKAEAFCSNIPYLQVVKPANQVTTADQGNVTPVLAAIPLVNPKTLSLKVDGVNILSALSIDPSSAFPGGPFSGDVTIGGTSVHVSDLIVRSAGVGTASSNTLSMNLTGMGCGGHIIVVNGTKRPLSFPFFPAATCDVDDLKDKGKASTFSVKITSPTPGEVTPLVPTPVKGEICDGLQIVAASVNGKAISVLGGTFTAGDGENSGDTYKVPIDVSIDQTDLGQDVASGDTPLGTFDAGSNRLVADATDAGGNRAFKTLIFATGNVAAPGVGTLAERWRGQLQNQLHSLAQEQTQLILDTGGTEIPNAFVVGLKPGAVQKLFNKLCVNAGQQFAARVPAKLIGKSKHLSPDPSIPCSCDPSTDVVITGVNIDASQVSCPVTFMDDKIHVKVNLPDVKINLGVNGYCEDTVLGGCWTETIVNMTVQESLTSLSMEFDITEDQLKGNAGPPPDPVQIGGSSSTRISGGVDTNCIGADLCDFFVTVFTLGLVDLTPEVDISKDTNFNTDVGAGKPDPIKLKDIKVDEEQVENFGQVLKGDLDTVAITPSGLTATLKGTFSTVSKDSTIPDTPGAVLTPAPSPATPIPGGGEAFVVLADDTLNQLFASMAASGKLKTGCQSSGKTVGDLLPASCSTLTGATDGLTAIIQGYCSGVKGIDCETLVSSSDLLTNTEQGACHGINGDNCSNIPVTGLGITEHLFCNASPHPNLHAATPLLFCVQTEIPPRILIQDNNATPAVETTLRLDDLSVAMVVDRKLAGLDGGSLPLVPKCFGTGSSTTTDCNLFAVCLDLNFLTDMQFQTCSDGKPGFVTHFDGIQVLNRQAGVVCGAATAGSDDIVTGTAAENSTIDVLGAKVDAFTPPVCANGLTLGGFVTFVNPKLISVETDGDTEFQDYLGITGDIAP